MDLQLIAKLSNGRADERSLLKFIRDDGNRAMDFHDATDGAKEDNFPLRMTGERSANTAGLMDDETGV